MLKTFLTDLTKAVLIAFAWVVFMTVSANWTMALTNTEAKLWVFATLVAFVGIGTFLPKLADRREADASRNDPAGV